MAESNLQASLVGKIKSVHCINFVTFSEIIFHPYEYLNILIAPNGCGKSTIVAAIVLCLGGEPQHLARANKIETYIKNGETTGVISVEIYSDNAGGTQTFQRTFNSDGKSEFRVDGWLCPKSKLLKVVAKYSIQVVNLCQLLPQDRVQDFAKMNAHELLENTISSVCSPEVIESFKRLKELRKSQLDDGKQVAVHKKKLEEARQQWEQLKEKVEGFQARRTLSSKVEVGAAKRLWLEAEQLHLKVIESKHDLDKSQINLNKYEQDCHLAKSKVRTVKNQQDKLADYMKRLEDGKNAALRKISDEQTLYNNLAISLGEKKVELNRKKKSVREREYMLAKELELLEIRMQDYTTEKNKIGSDQERQQQELELNDKITNLNAKIANLNAKHVTIRSRLDRDYIPEIQLLKSRIEIIKNRPNKKMKYLKDRHSHVYQAVLWLEKNRGLFKGRIHNPVLLEIDTDPSHAIYVENVVPMRDLLAFVCEDKSDMSRLVTELCTNQKLQINVAHSPAASSCDYKAQLPIASIRRFGFSAYLKDLVRAPPAILNYLCSLCNIHAIPIGDESVNANTDAIPQTIRNYFGGDKRFNLIISKYSGERSLSTCFIKGKDLLSAEKDHTEELENALQQLVIGSDELRNERTAIECQITLLESQRSELKKKKSELVAQVHKVQLLKGQLKRQRDKCGELKANDTSIQQIEAEMKEATQCYVQKAKQMLKNMIEESKAVRQAIAAFDICQKKNAVIECSNALIINAVQEATDRLRNAQTLHGQVQAHFENYKRNHESKTREALESTNNCKPSDRDFPNKQLYRELPNTIQELDEAIDEYCARLDCMAADNKNIMEQFHKKKCEVQALEEAIEAANKNKADAGTQISTIYSEWTSTVTSVIGSMNTEFASFMRKLDYTGEVQLSKTNDYDFSSYGIRIMVAFRKNVPLEPLTRTRQSGGERAVSIAMYTLALQHLTRVPFRCVDEINQGMDPRNEHKVFKMLVAETTKTGSSQYFYITPKLNDEVAANPRVGIHIVFNGSSCAVVS